MAGIRIFFYLGILFSAIGTASLIFTRDVLAAAIWLSFGNGLILADPRLLRSKENTASLTTVPPARRYTSYFLIFLALVLLVFQIYKDNMNKIEVKPPIETVETEAK